MPTDYGNFHNFCRDSTLPVCNLFGEFKDFSKANHGQIGGYSAPGNTEGCHLSGIPLGGGRQLQNLGVILLCGIAIFTTLFLIWRTQTKKAAVGRREMQIFLTGFVLIEICEIFTVGGFPLNETVRIGFTGAHIGLIAATTWVLLLNAVINGAVGMELIDDGTIISIILTLASAACFLVGVGYVALDTGLDWSHYWNGSVVQADPNRSYALYTLYFLVPLLFLCIYFLVEAVVVVGILGEKKPMIFLASAAILFAVGQVFEFVISVHICTGVDGKIDGSMFETLFTFLAVVMIWVFWSSITEDDWPQEALEAGGTASAYSP